MWNIYSMPVRDFSGMMGNTGRDYFAGNKPRCHPRLLRELCEGVEVVAVHAIFAKEDWSTNEDHRQLGFVR